MLTHDPPVDEMTDAQAVIDHVMTGKPLDPAVARRVQERARSITRALQERYGELDIGVPAIRELRGELPE